MAIDGKLHRTKSVTAAVSQASRRDARGGPGEPQFLSFTDEANWLKSRLLDLQSQMAGYSKTAQLKAQSEFRIRNPRSRPEDWIAEKQRLFGPGDAIKREIAERQARLIQIKDRVTAEHNISHQKKDDSDPFRALIRTLVVETIQLRETIARLTDVINQGRMTNDK